MGRAPHIREVPAGRLARAAVQGTTRSIVPEAAVTVAAFGESCRDSGHVFLSLFDPLRPSVVQTCCAAKFLFDLFDWIASEAKTIGMLEVAAFAGNVAEAVAATTPDLTIIPSANCRGEQKLLPQVDQSVS
jgi:hypothetical protein